MFCEKCGKENLDYAAFCADCGAPLNAAKPDDEDVTVRIRPVETVIEPANEKEAVPVEAAAEPEVPAFEEDAPTGELAQEDAPTGDLSSEDAPVFDLNTEGVVEEKPKKKKTGLVIGCIAAVLVVAIALCCIFLWQPISATFNWIFLSPEKNLEKVYDQAVVNAFASGTEKVGSMSTVDYTNTGLSGEIEISADKSIVSLLSSASGEDLSWLESAAISYDASVLNQAAKMDYDFKVNNTNILEMEQVIDFTTMDQYISIPEFSDSFARIQMYDDSDYLASYNPMDSMNESMAMLESVMDICPSQEVLEGMVRRYVGVIIKGFGSVEKSTETVEIGDIKQNLRVIEATMDQDDMVDMAINLMETLQDDEDIEDILRDLEELTGESGLYDEFCESLDEAIAEIEETDIRDMVKMKITLVTYLNSSNEIVGNSIKASAYGNKMEPFRWVKVESGKKFAVEVAISGAPGEEIVLEGEGTTGKTKNATYTLSAMDEDVLEIEVIDYVFDAKTGMSGTLKITPSEYVMESILESADVDAAIAGLISSQEPALQIEFSGTGENANVSISLLANSKKMLTISSSSKFQKAAEFEIPTNYVDEDEWVNTMDEESAKQTLISRLRAAGFPEDLLSQLAE